VIAGVDVGAAGAVCFIEHRHSEFAEALDLPVYVLARGGRAKREFDIAGLIRVLARRRSTHAFVEQVGAMPGQRVSGVPRPAATRPARDDRRHGEAAPAAARRDAPGVSAPHPRLRRMIPGEIGANLMHLRRVPGADHECWRPRLFSRKGGARNAVVSPTPCGGL